jgi:hypothetical protein
VDQALRARANAFLDYQSKGDFRKAYELVAEDSKDYYFSAPKNKVDSFTIDEVQYSADFSMATVKSVIKRKMVLSGHELETPHLESSQWKLEKGEWVWYHDPSKDVTETILGQIPAVAGGTATPLGLPKDMSAAAVAAAASKITPKAAIDKPAVVFTLGKEGTDQVTFHNSNNGQVRVYAEVRGVADTITVEPNDVMVNAQADVPFKITYKPHPESSMQGGVLFTVEPFGSVIALPVRFARERQLPKPAAPVPVAPAPAVP